MRSEFTDAGEDQFHSSVPGAEAAIWVVRADGGKYADRFLAGGYVAVGWFDLSFAESREQIRKRYRQEYPDASVGRISNETGQLVAFRFEMAEGDYVITPTSDREALRYGRIAGPCVVATGDSGSGHRNRRSVEWAPTPLNRSDFSESFQNTLGSLRTVFRVSHRKEFLAAIEAVGPYSVAAEAGKRPGTSSNKDDSVQEPAPDDEGVATHSVGATDPDTGFETEGDDSQQSVTDQPFDPSLIKVRTINVVVEQIVTRIKYDEIDLQPDFQRVRGIWDVRRKSRLIESLLLRIPIPVFYVAANHDDKWAVVDGVQRMSTIHGYMTGVFPLVQLEYRKKFEGKKYDELPRPMQRRISETQLVVNVIEPGTPPEVMFNIFRRINTGGMTLNGQEIRHALNPGRVRSYLEELANSDEFLRATDESIKKRRMADRECVLRFLAFSIDPWEQYATSSLETYLENAMKKINDMVPEQRETLAVNFRKAMRAATRIFGDDAFRKRYRPEDGRHPISLALFEVWSVQLARCSPHEIDRLVERRADVRERFMSILNEDADFEKAISVSTGTAQRIRKRFAAVHDLVQEFL